MKAPRVVPLSIDVREAATQKTGLFISAQRARQKITFSVSGGLVNKGHETMSVSGVSERQVLY